MNKTNLNNANLLIVYRFIEELDIKINKQIRLNSDIYIHILNNELLFDIYTKYNGKKYGASFGIKEIDLRNNNEPIYKLKFYINNICKFIKDKIRKIK